MKIVNTYDQVRVAGGGVIITWTGGNSAGANCYVVHLIDANGKEHATDANAAWYHYKRKAFSGLGRESKKRALMAAQKWVMETYPNQAPKFWARNRMGDYLDAEINKKFPLKVS